MNYFNNIAYTELPPQIVYALRPEYPALPPCQRSEPSVPRRGRPW